LGKAIPRSAQISAEAFARTALRPIKGRGGGGVILFVVRRKHSPVKL